MRPLRRVTIIGGRFAGEFDAQDGTHRLWLDPLLGVVRVLTLATGAETWISRSRCVVEVAL